MVCGSTQGIGKSVAIELANLGANVILVARSEQKLSVLICLLVTHYCHFSGLPSLSDTTLSFHGIGDLREKVIFLVLVLFVFCEP